MSYRDDLDFYPTKDLLEDLKNDSVNEENSVAPIYNNDASNGNDPIPSVINQPISASNTSANNSHLIRKKQNFDFDENEINLLFINK